MQRAIAYDGIEETFPAFGDTAQGYHSILYERYTEGDGPAEGWGDEPGEYWTSARLYLDSYDEFEEPENLVLGPLTASSTIEGNGSVTRFRIDNDTPDFEKAMGLRDLLDIDDMDDHLSFDGDEVEFRDINTPADTVAAIDAALKDDKTFYITSEFANTLKFVDDDTSKYDQDILQESGEQFYTDVLNNAEFLDGPTYNSIASLAESIDDLDDGPTGVIALSKKCYDKIDELDRDDTIAYPPRIAHALLDG